MNLPRKVSIVEFCHGCRVPHSAGGVATGLIAEKHAVSLTLNEYGIHAVSLDKKFEGFYPHSSIKMAQLAPIEDQPVARGPGRPPKAVSAA